MRFLYLDDSGKPDPKHQSKCLVFAGFSVDESKWHAVARQLCGAKSRFFPNRGGPHDWEIKSLDVLPANNWKRSKNRKLCFEVVDILRRNECTVYSVWLNKAHATKPLDASVIVPHCFQALASKFHCELMEYRTTGAIVCDWSTHPLDRHVSNCVQSFVVARGITDIVGGVSYGSSQSTAAIQACDLIAGVYRRVNEGSSDHLKDLLEALRQLRRVRPGETDVAGYSSASEAMLF